MAQEHFDLVILDVRMPVLDGLETTRRIRAGQGGQPQVVVAALTAQPLDQGPQDLVSAGMDHCLSKPLDFEALNKLLAGIAGQEKK